MHVDLQCIACHPNPAIWPITIKSCYDANCHPRSNNNLTNISTLATIDGIDNVSIYSTTNGSVVIPFSVHNGSQYSNATGVPCWICHGPAHNVTKPDPLSANTNNITEYTQCVSCHNAYRRHNNSVNCTVCHSQDAHIIKVFAQNATYINGSTSTDRGNCTNCHQNSAFLTSLLLQPRAGSYDIAINPPPQIPKPLTHGAANAGRRWNQTPGYWISGTDGNAQKSSCIYCHNDTKHNDTALGRPSLFKGNNTISSTISANTSWCASCHWQGYVNGLHTYKDTVTIFDRLIDLLLVPPEITGNATYGNYSSNTAYYNHSNETKDDASCANCHGGLTSTNITGFMHNVAIGGPNCINCHDTGGIAQNEVRFSDLNNTDSVHHDLNVITLTSNSANNSHCWACHGDGNGSESAQPTDRHPSSYNTPKNCNNNNCHSISQSQYNETMIYSHFKNASLNNNLDNNTNYNITVSEQCQNCHINSIVTDDGNSNMAMVSHYASKKDLIDSFNCVYCHLDKDNSESWGNATLINKDREGTTEVNRENNNLTLSEGQTVYLGEGYSLKLMEISALRGDALMQILNKGNIVDQVMVHKDTPYTYERDITIDNATFKTPAVTINISSIFTGIKDSLIKFEAYRPRKIHTEKESKNIACFACHLYRYSNEKKRYKVIDREADDDGQEIIYYTNVLLDHKLENKSKIYFIDEDYVFGQLGIMDKFISVPTYQKYLEDRQIWQIADKYSLKFRASSTDRQAWLEFKIDNKTVEDEVVTAGSLFDYYTDIRYKEYTDTNTTIFTSNISSVFLGLNDFIILKDSELLSTQILKTRTNLTQFGYNGSWLHPGYRFTLGKIPSNLHVPNLFDDQRNWADCVGCHDASMNLRITQIDAISSRLGKHSILNAAAPDKSSMPDSIDKACLACHTEGREPITHSPTYLTPRNCISCHVYQEEPFYGAKNISDEPHGSLSGCESCHTSGSHIIIRPTVSPAIDSAALTKSQIKKGETVELIAKVKAGYVMKIRSAEYFIDTKGTPGNGIPLKPVDGAFDSQVEQVAANISTGNISTGAHIIYIHAMERANRWSDYYSVNFSVISNEPGSVQPFQRISSLIKRIPAFNGIFMLISIIIAYILILNRGRRAK